MLQQGVCRRCRWLAAAGQATQRSIDDATAEADKHLRMHGHIWLAHNLQLMLGGGAVKISGLRLTSCCIACIDRPHLQHVQQRARAPWPDIRA